MLQNITLSSGIIADNKTSKSITLSFLQSIHGGLLVGWRATNVDIYPDKTDLYELIISNHNALKIAKLCQDVVDSNDNMVAMRQFYFAQSW